MLTTCEHGTSGVDCSVAPQIPDAHDHFSQRAPWLRAGFLGFQGPRFWVTLNLIPCIADPRRATTSRSARLGCARALLTRP